MFHVSLNNTSGCMLPMSQHSEKSLVEVNPCQSWLWKQNGARIITAMVILEVVKNCQ